MPPAPYQLVKKRCKAGYSRDVKGGSMCNPKPGYTPKATASTRPRDKMGRFVSENTPLSQYASYKKGTIPGVKLPPGFKFAHGTKKPAGSANKPVNSARMPAGYANARTDRQIENVRQQFRHIAQQVDEIIEEL